MFKRIVSAAALAGVFAGLLLTAIQQIEITPLIREAPAYDLFYLRRWSLRLDFWILTRTALHAVD